MPGLTDWEDVELVRNSDMFDAKWYLASYPDVALLGMDPAEHFVWLGWRLGRSPCAAFSAPSYLEAYPDVAKTGVNPLLHYLRFGRKEDRLIHPVIQHKAARQLAQRQIARRHEKWDSSLSDRAVLELTSVRAPVEAAPVSIIMPARNREATIGAAIASVLRQSHANFELIVIDDGSTDRTRAVTASFDDKRIRYVANGGPNGVSRARNLGLDLAEGDWVFFLDSDNIWDDRMIEFMLRHAELSDVSAGYCAANMVDDQGKRKAVLYADFDYESCLRSNYIDLNCFFVRWQGEFRQFRFNETLRRLVDWEFILRIGARTRIAGTPYIGVDYFDGTAPRITNSEHSDRQSLGKLIEQIREIGRENLLHAPVIEDSSFDRLAVVLHVFHPESVPECLAYLRNIPFDFDLFVTTSLEEGDSSVEAVRTRFPSAKIFRFPNYGADIGPFLELISTLKTYPVVGKIHTKRNVGKWGSSWRDLLMNSVLASPEYVRDVIGRFKENRNLGLVCSRELYKLGSANSIAETRAVTDSIARDIGLDQHLEKDWSFVAGTMFWIRPQYLLGLARYMCDSEGYSARFRRDGAIEHGVERAIGLALWQDPATEVGLASDGRLAEVVPLGAGHSTERVSATLARLWPGEHAPASPPAGPSIVREQTRPLVTTAIVSYNQKDYIAGAIESALAQRGDFKHEILIADDGSTDGTAETAAMYARRHPDAIRCIGGRQNVGISENFKRCFKEARGEFVAILEGDDFWPSERNLDKKVRFLTAKPDASMVFSRLGMLHPGKREEDVSFLERQLKLRKDTLTAADFIRDPDMNLIVNFSSCLFRTDLMREIPESLYQYRLSEIGVAFFLDRKGSIGYVDEHLTTYRVHESGVWSGLSPADQLRSARRIRKVLLETARPEYLDDIRRVIEEKYDRRLTEMGEPLEKLPA